MSTSPEAGGNVPARVQIGRIVGSHGVRGTLRIHPLTDYPERFFDMKTLHVEKPGKPAKDLEVLSVSSHEGKGQILVTVTGINDCDRAKEFAGWLITVAGDERVELPEGEYWIDSLIGMDVVDSQSGEHLGKIDDVMSTGSNDIYQVRTPDGTPKLVPAVADVIREIDVDSGVMKVTLPEGLWD
jgi:16S rRNA processing protein RimM